MTGLATLRKAASAQTCTPLFDMEWMHEQLRSVDYRDRGAVRSRLWEATASWLPTAAPAYCDLAGTALSRMPTMNGRDLARYGEQYLNPALDTEVVLLSGGSTSERSKLIHRALFEFRLVEEFEQVFLGPYEVPGVVLQMGDIAHGLRVPQRSWRGRELIQVPVSSPTHFRLVADIVADVGTEVVAVNGPGHTIQLFTEWALSQGTDLASTTVRELMFGGTVVSDRWTGILTSAWGARIRSMFGLTEFHQGHAIDCDHCGAAHFGHGVLPEYLRPGTDEPVRPGEHGEVVLTHLLPLAQRQPLLRYRTGDLVLLTPRCEAARDIGIRPVARLLHTKDFGDGRFWPAFAVAAALDDFPALYRRPVRLLSRVESLEVAVPNHFTTFVDGQSHLHVELRADTRLDERSVADLTARIVDRVRQVCAKAWGCSMGEVPGVEVSVHHPGELREVVPQ